MTNPSNGAANAAPSAAPIYARVELETYVQTEEGYIFRAVFRDTPLADAVEMLKKKGCTPAAPVARAAADSPKAKAKAPRVNPEYNGQGEPCCPSHRRVLKEGQWGLYCSAKDKDSGAYCDLKFNN